MKHFLIWISITALLVSCSKSENDTKQMARRTVIVYMSGENNLSDYSFLPMDINEMIEGRKKVADNENLILYVDKASSTEKPFIARITTDSKNPVDTLYKYPDDILSSDYNEFRKVLQWVVNNCPASEDYGLVLWGHANGWIFEKEATSQAPQRAYGVDTGNNSTGRSGKWMNIPSMRSALESLGVKWKFIFCDCCNMQNVETAYELSGVTQYFIASPAEITGIGAPYKEVVKDLFKHDDVAMYTGICDDYYAQVTDEHGNFTGTLNRRLPISVVKTDMMKNLATETNKVLPQIADYLKTNPTMQGMIYYYNYYTTYHPASENVLYDMKDVIQAALGADSEAYKTWEKALDAAVIYKKNSGLWHSEGSVIFSDFDYTEERQGCISMFFPLAKYSSTSHAYNTDFKKMQWYQAVGWSSVGW